MNTFSETCNENRGRQKKATTESYSQPLDTGHQDISPGISTFSAVELPFAAIEHN